MVPDSIASLAFQLLKIERENVEFFFFLQFCFYFIFIEIQLIYNVVLVSGVSKVIQLYIYINICIFFNILFHYRLLQDIEYSSLYCVFRTLRKRKENITSQMPEYQSQFLIVPPLLSTPGLLNFQPRTWHLSIAVSNIV